MDIFALSWIHKEFLWLDLVMQDKGTYVPGAVSVFMEYRRFCFFPLLPRF
jgi:hypothetical protein